MTSTGERPAQKMENGRNKWEPIQTGKLESLKYCSTAQALVLWSLQRVWDDSQQLCETKLKLLTGKEQITPLSNSFPCQPGEDSFSQPSQGECVDEKERRDTSSPTGTWLPVVPVNNWTTQTCPAANLDFFQLQDPSNSDQEWGNSSWKQRSFHCILCEEEANKNTDSFGFWNGMRRNKD